MSQIIINNIIKNILSIMIILNAYLPVFTQNISINIPSLVVRNGLSNSIKKLKTGKNVTIAYLGGSITNHEGYRVYTTDWLKKEFPKANITSINAGIGGTGSDLGVFRLQNDVLKFKPDLVFVEFAVNDAGTDSVIMCNAMEGIVRKIKKQNPNTEICFLYTIMKSMLPAFEKGELFRSVRLMERIATHYGIPSINFGVDVYRLLKDDKLIFQADKDVKIENKIIFTNDNVHPTLDQGHKVYTQTFIAAIKEIQQTTAVKCNKIPKAMFEGLFDNANLYSPLQFERSQGWKPITEAHPFYKTNKLRCPDLILTNNPNDSISIRFKGKVFGVYDILGPNSIGFTATIDGKTTDIQRFDKYCTYYRNNYTLLPLMSDSIHTIVLKMNTQKINKEEILKQKHDNSIDETIRKQLDENVLYTGSILIAGKIK